MSELEIPWLGLAVLTPLVGAVWVRRCGDSDVGRAWWLFFSGLTLALTVAAWIDFYFISAEATSDRWHLLAKLLHRDRPLLEMDHLSAPLLPLVSLLFFLTAAVTLQSKLLRYSFAWKLLSEGILLATLACREPWAVIVLLALGTLPPILQLRARGKPTRPLALHMALYVLLLIVGEALVEHEDGVRTHTLWAIVPLLGAVLIRSGIVPFHCWVPHFFEHATLGTAILFVAPLTGAYAAARLVLPIAPDWILRSLGFMSLLTAVYAAGMALIQQDARRFFSFLFLSHSALVLVGLEMVTLIGLTGGLCVWLSISVALSGFGLTLRALEARRGRLSLLEFQGLYEHTPTLAMCFVLTGLASVGFPGTFGFVGMELLIDGAVDTYPHVGMAVVVAAALNGIAVVQAYFHLFTGTRYLSTVSLWMRLRERYAVLTLAVIILLGGFIPQPGVTSRHHAAEEMLKDRRKPPVLAPASEAALALPGSTE